METRWELKFQSDEAKYRLLFLDFLLSESVPD
jgi:hypothetical protein